MFQIQLRPGLPGGRWACLRSLCGHDEALIDGTSPWEATVFLDRLLVETPGTSVGPGRAWDLALSDRDRLLATIYMQFGIDPHTIIQDPQNRPHHLTSGQPVRSLLA